MIRNHSGILNKQLVYYFAWVWRQLGIHREGTSRDSVSVVGHIDGMDSLLCGGVPYHPHICFTRLRRHFARYHPLVGAQLR